MRTVIGLALATAVAATSMERPMYEGYTYEQFLQEHNKPALFSAEHSVEEFLGRQAIFDLNLAKIRRHNANPNKTWWMAVNKFADMTSEEINAKFMGRKHAHGKRNALSENFVGNGQFLKTRTMGSYPEEVNWPARGAIPKTTNQQHCGSCWAHSADHTIMGTASIEFKKQTGKYLDASFAPSRQQITACTPNDHHCGGTGGCSGATAQLAFDYIEKAGGLVAESVYPYTAGEGDTGICQGDLVKKAPKIVSIGGFKSLASNDLDELMSAVQESPVAVSVAASNWAFYGGGIFNECHTGETDKKQDNVINHAVTLVGYGKDDAGQSYWLVQNSWGDAWGSTACDDTSNPNCKMAGFIKVKRANASKGEAEKCGTDAEPMDGSACDGETDPVTVCGECGILYDSSIVTGVHVNSTALGFF